MSLSLKELQKHAEDILPHKHDKKSSKDAPIVAGTGGKTNYRVLPNLRFAYAMPLVLLVAGIGIYSLLFSQAATALYISPNGNDANTCTQPSPCKSLARAYQVAVAGDTVKILDGTYGEQNLASGTKAMIFEAAGPGRPAFGKTSVDASNLIIRGLQFESRSEGGPAAFDANGANNLYDNIIVDGQGVKLLGMGFSGTSSKIMNSEIKNVTDEKGILASGEGLTVDNVYVHDVTMSTYGASIDVHNECIYAIVVPNFTLKNSKFWNCSVMDVFFTYGFWWNPLPPDYGNVTIENNVFDVSRRPNSERYHYYAVVVAGTGDMDGAGCFAPVTNWKVRYNSFMGPMIFSENEAPCSVTRPVSGSEFTGNLGYYECLGGNTVHRYNVGTACSGGVNNKNISPNTYDGVAPDPSWFMDPLNNNFKLTANSLAIDAGDPTNFPTKDKDGNDRPIGVAPDSGAYEYGATSGGGVNLWVDPDGGTCIKTSVYATASACTFDQAYQNASPGDTVLIRGGSYPGTAEVNGTTTIQINVSVAKVSASQDVVFQPDTGADINLTADRLVVYGSHIQFKGNANPYNFHLKNLIVNATQGANNQNHVTYENLDAKAFYIGPVSNVTLKGGNYGPNIATCNDVFGSVYEPHISNVNGWETGSQPAGMRPTGIILDGVSIHGQTSTDLTCQHTGGLIMADGDGVTIRNSKFYANNVYDIEVGDTGTTPDGVTLENNWFAPGTDQNGNDAGQREVQFAQDGAFDNWLVRYNSFKNGLDIKVNRANSTHSNMRVIGNIGVVTDCNVAGVMYAYNAWVGGRCSGDTLQLSNFPYVSTSITAPNYHLSGVAGSSPAENFVTPTSADYALGTDIDGESRNVPRDAGADERTGSLTAPKPGDVNGDGNVNITDISQLLSAYGQTGTGLPADLDKNGSVNIADLSIILANYGK